MNEARPARPWYRELWPWLLMLPPAAAVLGGVMMVYLATHTQNALVVEDYARIEELTSTELARDRRARELGLASEMRFSAIGNGEVRVAVELDGNSEFAAPAELTLHLQHATNQAADRTLVLQRAALGYTGLTVLAAGRYDIEVTPVDRSWRLAGSVRGLPATLRVTAVTPGG